jgi:hypothetical protein
MVDLHAVISEAGAKGISLAKLREKSKLKDAPLEDKLKQLRSELLIAGPFKYKQGFLFYAKGYEPGGESVGRLIEASIRDAGAKLSTSKEVEKKIKQPFKDFFKDGVRAVVGKGHVAELKGGTSTYLLHIDVARRLFPRIEASPDGGMKIASSSSFKGHVLDVYRALKSEQGGLSAVSIGKLLNRLGCSKQALHRFLLEEAREENVDLHPTTLVDLGPEDREGALHVPGKSEAAITVTFRE